MSLPLEKSGDWSPGLPDMPFFLPGQLNFWNRTLKPASWVYLLLNTVFEGEVTLMTLRVLTLVWAQATSTLLDSEPVCMYPSVTGSRRAHPAVQQTTRANVGDGMCQRNPTSSSLNSDPQFSANWAGPTVIQEVAVPFVQRKLLLHSLLSFSSHCCYCSLPSKLNFSEERRWKHAHACLHTHTHVCANPSLLSPICLILRQSVLSREDEATCSHTRGRSEWAICFLPPPPPPKDVLSSSSSTCWL